MSEMNNRVTFELPAWTEEVVASFDPLSFVKQTMRMQLAIALAQTNIRNKSGGPFGAAIFSATTHELIAVGVNMVTRANCSILHAEMVAIMMAQRALGTYDLATVANAPLELVTSVAPCAMCLGAVPWSGIKQLVCGARDEDARAIGFDEGAKMTTWCDELLKRGISTTVDVERDAARGVLEEYKVRGGEIYNP